VRAALAKTRLKENRIEKMLSLGYEGALARQKRVIVWPDLKLMVQKLAPSTARKI
jgi:hypothetical protein